MPASDLLSRVADGQRLNRVEIEALKADMRRLENLSGAGNITDSSGNIDPNVFYGKRMNVLPHETSSAYVSKNVATASFETLEFQTSGGDAIRWEQGLKVDTTNHRIYISGTPGKTIFLIAGWLAFAGSPTYIQAELWNSLGYVTHLFAIGGISGAVTRMPLLYVREAILEDDYYFIKAYHNVGSTQNIGGQFSVTRLR